MAGRRRGLGRPAGGKDLGRMNCFVWEVRGTGGKGKGREMFPTICEAWQHGGIVAVRDVVGAVVCVCVNVRGEGGRSWED